MNSFINYPNIVKKNIIFFSTPFDLTSAIFLNKIQKLFKISSGDNNFTDLISLLICFIIAFVAILGFKGLAINFFQFVSFIIKFAIFISNLFLTLKLDFCVSII